VSSGPQRASTTDTGVQDSALRPVDVDEDAVDQLCVRLQVRGDGHPQQLGSVQQPDRPDPVGTRPHAHGCSRPLGAVAPVKPQVARVQLHRCAIDLPLPERSRSLAQTRDAGATITMLTGRKAVGVIHRRRAQRPEGDVEHPLAVGAHHWATTLLRPSPARCHIRGPAGVSMA
jgi:hypothetical protein